MASRSARLPATPMPGGAAQPGRANEEVGACVVDTSRGAARSRTVHDHARAHSGGLGSYPGAGFFTPNVGHLGHRDDLGINDLLSRISSCAMRSSSARRQTRRARLAGRDPHAARDEAVVLHDDHLVGFMRDAAPRVGDQRGELEVLREHDLVAVLGSPVDRADEARAMWLRVSFQPAQSPPDWRGWQRLLAGVHVCPRSVVGITLGAA